MRATDAVFEICDLLLLHGAKSCCRVRDVRLAALKTVLKTRNTLGSILDRSMDVEPTIRKQAYNIISTFSPKQFTIAQRVAIMRNGLGDRYTRVASSSPRLLLNWACLARV